MRHRIVVRLANARGTCLATTLLLLTLATPAGAQQSQPLVTDRPDQTESATTVRPGVVQLEIGVTLGGDDAVRTVAAPEALVRVGLARRLEARATFAGWMRAVPRFGGGAAVHGVGDVGVGFKYRLTDGDGWPPAAAVVADLTLPTGDEGFGSPRTDPTLLLAAAHEVGEAVGIGYNLGAAWATVDEAVDVTTAHLLYSFVVGLSVHNAVAVFLEPFGALPLNEAAASRYALDGGLTLRLRRNLQLDVSAGFGLPDPADDWFAGAGVSVRLPR